MAPRESRKRRASTHRPLFRVEGASLRSSSLLSDAKSLSLSWSADGPPFFLKRCTLCANMPICASSSSEESAAGFFRRDMLNLKHQQVIRGGSMCTQFHGHFNFMLLSPESSRRSRLKTQVTHGITSIYRGTSSSLVCLFSRTLPLCQFYEDFDPPGHFFGTPGIDIGLYHSGDTFTADPAYPLGQQSGHAV